MVNQKAIYGREHQVLVRRIREARLQAGMTQKQLAERLGKRSHSAIVKLESGQVRVEVIELRRFCGALDISFRAFINDLEDELSNPVKPDADR